MAPTLIRYYNLKPDKLSTFAFIREADSMDIQSALHSRSNSATSGSSGSIDVNTVIFIVVGAVCLLVILLGFHFVSRHRAASNAALGVHSPQPPITRSSRSGGQPDMSERLKIWKIWGRGDPVVHTTDETPPLEILPAPPTIASPPQSRSARVGSKTYPPIVPRPSQTRRVTSLSVTTSFSHSHITQEDLNTFRVSAYDLDGDLESEMLNSATDDVWLGQVLAVEEGCESVGVGVAEAMEARGNASPAPIVGGSVEGYVPPQPSTQWRGGDYEHLGRCHEQGVEAEHDHENVKGAVIEVDIVAMGRQACQ